jgi:two-component system sensor histidine kinase SenX3
VEPLLRRKRQTVSIEGPELPVYVLGDRLALLHVMANLLVNAGAYSPEGEQVSVQLTHTDGWIEVRVVDRGAGVAESEQSAIFERFRRGASAQCGGRGLGLGLYIVKSIVETYGGTVGVVSAIGEGSTFWIRLPEAVSESSAHDKAIVDGRAA